MLFTCKIADSLYINQTYPHKKTDEPTPDDKDSGPSAVKEGSSSAENEEEETKPKKTTKKRSSKKTRKDN